MANIKNDNFESKIFQIEEIIKKIEDGDNHLEELISDYKKARSLIENCENMLDQVEKELIILKNEGEKA